MIFYVNVTSQTPLSFRQGRSKTATETLSYIPGTALLASLVNSHSLLRNDVEELEKFLFRNMNQVSNLYPAFSENEHEIDNLKKLRHTTLPVYPLPNTARSCKRFNGFLFDAPEVGDHHGVSDHLCYWGLFELSGRNNIKLLDSYKDCPYETCKETIDRFEGFYRRGHQADQWGKPEAKSALRMHTGINRATGTVKQEILYARESLTEKLDFWGTIQIADEIVDDFEEFIEEASDERLIRVGNNRTRGLGCISVRISEYQTDTIEALRERILAFDTNFRTLAEREKIKADHAVYLSITLTSDVILLDHLLRYVGSITPSYLQDHWGISEAELIYSNVSSRRVMGWNGLWQMPKSDDLAMSMGSVFLYGLKQPLDDTLLETLLTMQTHGIGMRRREGFGQLLVASQFHYEVNNV